MDMKMKVATAIASMYQQGVDGNFIDTLASGKHSLKKWAKKIQAWLIYLTNLNSIVKSNRFLLQKLMFNFFS